MKIPKSAELSSSRDYSWKREEECGLDDVRSCPRSSPQQLTYDEVEAIKEMVTSDEYRHVPTATLAILAQRIGTVSGSNPNSRAESKPKPQKPMFRTRKSRMS